MKIDQLTNGNWVCEGIDPIVCSPYLFIPEYKTPEEALYNLMEHIANKSGFAITIDDNRIKLYELLT